MNIDNKANKSTKIHNKTAKLLIGLHIGFLLLCAIFLSLSLSMLSDSKTATGTVTFALTNSPELSMNLNFKVKGTEHTTYLGTNQANQLSNEGDVFKVSITQTSSVTVTAKFNDNVVAMTDGFSLITNDNVQFTTNIEENNVTFVSKTNVQNGDFIILDELLNAIYPTIEASNQSYSIEITSQAGNSVPATAKLSGIYSSIVMIGYSIQFNSNGGTDVAEQMTNENGQITLSSDLLPEKVGFVFVNWNSEIDGSGQSYEAGGTYTFTSNTILYAQWFSLSNLTFTLIDGTQTYSVKGNNSSVTEIIIPAFVKFDENGTAYASTQQNGGYAVVTIERDAFSYYKNLKSITIPNGITTIEGGAFAYCSALTSLRIPASVVTFTEEQYADAHMYFVRGCNLLHGTLENPVIIYDGLKADFAENGNGCGSDGYYYVRCADGVIAWEQFSDYVCCVYEDTLITLADGTTKRADEIEVGDKIQSYNFETGKIEIDTILGITNPNRKELVTITFKDGTNIKLTNDHPLYTELGWKCYDKDLGEIAYSELGIVGEFTVGDKLFSINKYFDKEISSISFEENETNGFNTYQFKVEKNKNFFANGILSSAN